MKANFLTRPWGALLCLLLGAAGLSAQESEADAVSAPSEAADYWMTPVNSWEGVLNGARARLLGLANLLPGDFWVYAEAFLTYQEVLKTTEDDNRRFWTELAGRWPESAADQNARRRDLEQRLLEPLRPLPLYMRRVLGEEEFTLVTEGLRGRWGAWDGARNGAPYTLEGTWRGLPLTLEIFVGADQGLGAALHGRMRADTRAPAGRLKLKPLSPEAQDRSVFEVQLVGLTWPDGGPRWTGTAIVSWLALEPALTLLPLAVQVQGQTLEAEGLTLDGQAWQQAGAYRVRHRLLFPELKRPEAGWTGPGPSPFRWIENAGAGNGSGSLGLSAGTVLSLRRDAARWERLPGGSYTRGTAAGDPEEGPAHPVRLDPFWMARTETTQAEWQAVMSTEPALNRGPDRPVEQVSWFQALQYCNALSLAEGYEPVYLIRGNRVEADFSKDGFRLPTEAEWEYAARGNGQVGGAWMAGEGPAGTKAVGTKAANGFGLHDLLGNVWEWTWDWYGAYESGAQTNPRGPAAGHARVIRGGSILERSEHVRPAYRFSYAPITRFSNLGFRVVRRAD